MKSTNKLATIDPVGYPYLGIFRDRSFVVLFTDKTEGTVVFVESSSPWPLGRYNTNWTSGLFTPFTGQITLEN